MPTKNDSVQPIPKSVVDNMNTSSYFDIEPYKKNNNAVYITTDNLQPEEYLLSAVNKANNTDTDGDGLPDWWEQLYGLDPANGADALVDTDSDGWNNLKEFQLSTDPQTANRAPVLQNSLFQILQKFALSDTKI
jgi:hypothetical protein